MDCADQERCSKDNPGVYIACVQDDCCHCADCFKSPQADRAEDSALAACCMRYLLTCKECGTKTKLQAQDFFEAGERFVAMGWRYDRLYKGYLCKKCSI